MSRYTFAVCLNCGVQSPPVIIEGIPPSAFRDSVIRVALKKMRWEYVPIADRVAGYCPQCKDAKKQAV